MTEISEKMGEMLNNLLLDFSEKVIDAVKSFGFSDEKTLIIMQGFYLGMIEIQIKAYCQTMHFNREDYLKVVLDEMIRSSRIENHSNH